MLPGLVEDNMLKMIYDIRKCHIQKLIFGPGSSFDSKRDDRSANSGFSHYFFICREFHALIKSS